MTLFSQNAFLSFSLIFLMTKEICSLFRSFLAFFNVFGGVCNVLGEFVMFLAEFLMFGGRRVFLNEV
jgi:hypothetical protein